MKPSKYYLAEHNLTQFLEGMYFLLEIILFIDFIIYPERCTSSLLAMIILLFSFISDKISTLKSV
jgi:hypothetical protein